MLHLSRVPGGAAAAASGSFRLTTPQETRGVGRRCPKHRAPVRCPRQHLRKCRTTRYRIARRHRPPAPRSARRLGACVRSERRRLRPRQHLMRPPGGQQRQPVPRRLPAAGRQQPAPLLRRRRPLWSLWVAPPCLSRPRPRRGISLSAFCR